MMQITYTTDGRFVGQFFDGKVPIVLGVIVIPIESQKALGNGLFMYSNSNYIIYAKEV